jgi:hypothetical protein
MHEENGIMRIEGRVEVGFNGGQIYGFVFQPKVIAMREKTQEGQKHENDDFWDFSAFCRLYRLYCRSEPAKKRSPRTNAGLKIVHVSWLPCDVVLLRSLGKRLLAGIMRQVVRNASEPDFGIGFLP